MAKSTLRSRIGNRAMRARNRRMRNNRRAKDRQTFVASLQRHDDMARHCCARDLRNEEPPMYDDYDVRPAPEVRRLLTTPVVQLPFLTPEEIASRKPHVHRAATMALFDPPRSAIVATVKKPGLLVRFIDWADEVYYNLMARYSTRPHHNGERG